MPDDGRLRRVAHWRDTFSMPAYASRDEWLERAAEIRRRVLFAAGLLPLPERTPLNPIVTGRSERDGYVVENVAFESFPGFYCTGNLYRPLSAGPFPVVLTPHGHGSEGRFTQRAESSVPARCINFARQGYLVFAPDMAGYNDSRQVPHRLFDMPERALWGIGALGLQLWNNVRALDYLCGLPDADPARVGCTGQSGGGTQTYLLAAVDERITVVAPVNMLSAHYAGGCVCENAPGLRLGLTNMEIVAAAAPRPMLLVAATGDWTVNTPRVEYPAVRGVYDLFDAGDLLECIQLDAPHNYNLGSREAVYGFFARYLGGRGERTEPPPSMVFRAGSTPPLAEAPDSLVDDVDPLRVFPAALPDNSLPGPDAVADALKGAARDRFIQRAPGDAAGLDRFRAVYGAAFSDALGASIPDDGSLRLLQRRSVQLHDLDVERLLISTSDHGEQIPAVFLSPRIGDNGSNGEGAPIPVLLVHHRGKEAWLDTHTLAAGLDSSAGLDGGAFAPLLSPLAADLVAAGRPILAIDPLLTGDFQSPIGRVGRPTSETHFAGYNRVDVAWQAQDVVTGAVALSHLTGASQVDVVATGDAGLWALLARAVAPALIRRLVADMAAFAWDDEGAYLDRLYVPHLLRLGGLTTAVLLAAPAPLYLYNAGGNVPPVISTLYAALDSDGALAVEDGPIPGAPP